jgi:hypothetical protein
MAKMFGLLPHEVLQRANTFDLMVVDILATYDEYERVKLQGAGAKAEDWEKFYATDDLQSLLESTREQHK